MMMYNAPGNYSNASIRYPRFEISYYYRGKRHYLELLPFPTKEHALQWIRRVFRKNGLQPEYYPEVLITEVDSFYDEWIKVTNDLKNRMRRS